MSAFERLPIRVRHRLGEPAIAALARAALRTGLGSDRELAAMFGLRFGDVARGRANAELAGVMGLDAKAFDDWTPVDGGEGRVTLRGEHLRTPHDISIGVGPLRRMRGCPECLRSDMSDPDGGPVVQRPHSRAWWFLRDVYTCPIHLCALAESSTAGRLLPPTRSPEARIRAYWGGICETPAVSVDAVDVLADTYVLGRLGAMPRLTVPFLDGVQLGEASAVLNWVGELAVSGTKASYVRKLPFKDAASMRSRGLLACNDWPRGLECLLREVQEAAPASVRGLKGRFGRFYSRLYDDRGSRANQEIRTVLRQVMRAYIVENVPLDLRETVFRDGVETSRRLTVGHAARICGIRPGKVLALAEEAGGLNEADPDARLYGLLREDVDVLRRQMAGNRNG